MSDIEPEKPRIVRLLTEAEVADILRVNTRTVRILRRSGQLAYIAGRPVRFDEQDVEDYIASVRVPAKARHSGTGATTERRSVASIRAEEEAKKAKELEAMNERIQKNALRRIMKSQGL